MFCNKNTLTEEKMCIVIEILHYLLRQILDFGEKLTEDKSYENFQELLLRHAVHRPPHSLAVLTLEEVKKVDLYVQDTFFRHFDMYKFSLVFKDELKLNTSEPFALPQVTQHLKISEGKKIKSSEINELAEYFSTEEQEAMRKEQEYMLHGPGKIQRLLDQEYQKL